MSNNENSIAEID